MLGGRSRAVFCLVAGLWGCNGSSSTPLGSGTEGSGPDTSQTGSDSSDSEDVTTVPISLVDYVVFDAPQKETIRSFIPRNDGGFAVLLGRSQSSGGNAESEIASYDAMPRRQWTVTVAPSGGFLPVGMTTTSSGANVVIAGANSTNANAPQNISLTLTDADGTTTQDLGEIEGPVGFVMSVSPDGRFGWVQTPLDDLRDVTNINGEVVAAGRYDLHRWALDGTAMGTTSITTSDAYRLQRVAFDGTSTLVGARFISADNTPAPFATVDGEPITFDGSDGEGILAGVDLDTGVQWAEAYRAFGAGEVTPLSDGSTAVVEERSGETVLVKNAVGSRSYEWKRAADGCEIRWIAQDAAGNLGIVGTHARQAHLENDDGPVQWLTPRSCSDAECNDGSFAASYTPDGVLRWVFLIDRASYPYAIVPAEDGRWWIAVSYDTSITLGTGGPQLSPTSNDDGDSVDAVVMRVAEG
jgi:hypothetical protein